MISIQLLRLLMLVSVCVTVSSSGVQATEPISVLLIDGQLKYHSWRGTTTLIQGALETTGRFDVEVLTLPPHKAIGPDTPRPDFSTHDLVVFNYNAPDWPDDWKQAFESFVDSGGGVVIVHSANNAFAEWPKFNRMAGLGGWGGRDKKAGSYVRWRDDKIVPVDASGPAGSHGQRHEYLIVNRNPEHPIMQGLPVEWLHSRDELYDRLRGPAQNMTMLATAFSDPKTGGSGEIEPIIWTVDYNNARIFHTVLGHDMVSQFNVGYQTTLARGAEWAATGEVTIPVPACFPTADQATTRHPLLNDKNGSVGWQALFGGSDLAGWEQVNGTADYRADKETATIIGTTSEGSPNSFLSTEKNYGDFELTFDVKLLDNELNSGVQIRSHQYAEDDSRRGHNDAGRVFGYQVEIEAVGDEGGTEKSGDAGFIYDEARRGWLRSERQDLPEARIAFKNGEWNHYRVLAVGDHLQTWVNGILCADVHDAEDASGGIMLQVHSIRKGTGPYAVAWRNIFLKDLSDQ